MIWTPRFYQTEATDAFFRSIKTKGTHPLIGMPTGSGKSGVLGMISNRAIRYPGVRVTVATHSKELVRQDARALLKINPDAPLGVYCSGLDSKQVGMPVTFASIQTAIKDPAAFGKQNILLIDEVQMVAPGEETSYRRFIDALWKENEDMVVGGLSATLYRAKGGFIIDNGIFNKVCYDITGREAFQALVRMGFLVPLRSHATKFTYDVTGVKTSGGDYNQGDLQRVVNDGNKTEIAVAEALQRGIGYKHTMWFGTGIEHVENITAILQGWGERAVCVHSKMSDTQRDLHIEMFLNGEVDHIVNDGILVVGFDCPFIDHLVILRPSKSIVRHVQLLGRGTRPVYADGYDLDTIEGRLEAIEASEKHFCYVSDFGGNLDRLGPINDPKIPGRKKKTGDMPIKICTTERLVSGIGCGCYNFCAARYCEDCGGEFVWDDEPKIQKGASQAVATALDEVVLIWAKIDRVEYAEFKRPMQPLAMKCHYYCGLNRYTEIVAIDSEAPYSRKRARDWWRERGVEPPETTGHGLALLDDIIPPNWVLVQINLKWPRVVQASWAEEQPQVEDYSNGKNS